MKQFKGKSFSGPEYMALCELRDKEKKFHEKLINLKSPRFNAPSILVKFPRIKKQQPGEYTHIPANDIEVIIINLKDEAKKQARWLECMVAIKDRGWEKYYLYFEPWFLEVA